MFYERGGVRALRTVQCVWGSLGVRLRPFDGRPLDLETWIFAHALILNSRFNIEKGNFSKLDCWSRSDRLGLVALIL